MLTKDEILKAKILIVDDQEQITILLKRILMREGYKNIETTTDSRKAINMYKYLQPDLVILDLDMPYIDGYKIMDELKLIEINSYSPVIVLTGYKDQESKIKALHKGAKDFLTKPFERTEALMRIYNLLELRLLHNKINNQNIILEKRVRERTKELKESQLGVVNGLSRAVEYRDNMTGLHIMMASRISVLIGEKIGLSEYQCELLMNSVPMHDIGKLAIPDSILLKPGKLNEQERKIMEKHTLIGFDLLSVGKSDLLKMAQTIALTHHEKWDGTGYPNQLKGEDIPLEGRICSIADVFDAITSERPYKKAKSIEEAINEIKNSSGICFDPFLIDAFLEVVPEISKLNKIKKYCEERILQFV